MEAPEFVAALFAATVAIAASYVALGSRQERLIAHRTALLVRAGDVLPRQAELSTPFARRAIMPILDAMASWAARLTPRRARALFESRLAAAGCYGPAVRRTLLAFQALCWLGAVTVGWLEALDHPAVGLLAAVAIAAVGVLLPRFYLVRRGRLRREQISRELPDILDLVTASVEAGLGFDASVLRVAERPQRRPSPLQYELGMYLSDVRLGVARNDALRQLADRTGVVDLQTVVAALIQSDQLGVGVSTVLRAQSQHVRTRRRQRAQAEALQAPIKLLFPLVFFIFPAMFVVTLGPAALRVLDTFGKVLHH